MLPIRRAWIVAMSSSFVVAVPIAAAALSDTDADLIPNYLDNCSTIANGPNQSTLQVDCDADGYGNRCDADYDNNLFTSASDFGQFLGGFGSSGACLGMDHDGNGIITAADFGIFLSRLNQPPGPSGLRCAGSTPCLNYIRYTTGPTQQTTGVRNEIASPTDFRVVTFEVPPGRPGELAFFAVTVGAPGGGCADGEQCYRGATYRLAGWPDLAAAEASPTAGTLFDVDVTSIVTIDPAGSSNDGVPGGPTFPLNTLTVDHGYLSLLGAPSCPATGCVIALLSEVGAVPGLQVKTRLLDLPGGPVDRTLCPVGCEGGLPVGTSALRFMIWP